VVDKCKWYRVKNQQKPKASRHKTGEANRTEKMNNEKEDTAYQSSAAVNINNPN